jgi:hypothetical protein
MVLLLVVGAAVLMAFRARTPAVVGSSAAQSTAVTDSSAIRTPSSSGTDQAAALPALTPTTTLSAVRATATPASDFDVLRGFSGRALVAPRGLKPFSDYPLSSVTYPYDGHGLTKGYQVAYGDRSAAHVNIAGFTGRALLDRANAPQTLNPCSADAPYCQILDIFREDAQGNPTEELFRSVSVGPNVAVATHDICCGDFNSWTIVWFDAAANSAYELVIVYTLPDVDHYGGSNLSETNVSSARMLSDLGRQLVPPN